MLQARGTARMHCCRRRIGRTLGIHSLHSRGMGCTPHPAGDSRPGTAGSCRLGRSWRSRPGRTAGRRSWRPGIRSCHWTSAALGQCHTLCRSQRLCTPCTGDRRYCRAGIAGFPGRVRILGCTCGTFGRQANMCSSSQRGPRTAGRQSAAALQQNKQPKLAAQLADFKTSPCHPANVQ
jgi:hypothetical protein